VPLFSERSMTRDELLACPPGTGVRVAIVDSGVDARVLGQDAETRSFFVRSRGVLTAVESCSPGDVSHHGTAVASIVRALAPAVELTSVRVVDEEGRGSATSLRAALEFCVRQRFDVVNLSLGTRRREVLLDLYELVDQAAVAGVVCVAATDNSGLPDYPAACTSLIAVDRGHTDDPFALRFRAGHRVAFLARGHEVSVTAPDGSLRVVSGASFACPHVTAMVARLRAAHPEWPPFVVKTALHALAASSPSPPRSPPTSPAHEPVAQVIE
jgi:subtilisin family serine protease